MKLYKVMSLPIVQVLLGFFIFGLFSLLLIVETIVFAAFFTVVACGAADQVARKFVSDRLCSVLLAATVSLSGFSSKLQIVILAVGGALLASGLISIVGGGGAKKSAITATHLVIAWLPAGLAGASVSLLSIKDQQTLGLLFVTAAVFDSTIYLMGSSKRRWLGPLLGSVGSLGLIYTTNELNLLSVAPNYLEQFALVMLISVNISWLASRYLAQKPGWAIRRIGCYIVSGMSCYLLIGATVGY
jgi:hypothetical protein|tara:strand:- start:173 stop:904 length:732 start_codon:yes stop_codon:yes gene_type:complete